MSESESVTPRYLLAFARRRASSLASPAARHHTAHRADLTLGAGLVPPAEAVHVHELRGRGRVQWVSARRGRVIEVWEWGWSSCFTIAHHFVDLGFTHSI